MSSCEMVGINGERACTEREPDGMVMAARRRSGGRGVERPRRRARELRRSMANTAVEVLGAGRHQKVVVHDELELGPSVYGDGARGEC